MDNVHGILFRNLKFGLSEPDLAIELVRIFPNVFRELVENNTLKIKMYHNIPRTIAVVSGFSVNFNDMQARASGETIYGRQITMKIDHGDERDEKGEFKQKLPPSVIRKLHQLTGSSHRKLTGVFLDSIWSEINSHVFDGILLGSIYLNTPTPNYQTLELPGRIKFAKPHRRNTSTRILYSSCMETMQAILYLNQNRILAVPLPYFTDANGTFISTCSGGIGIGRGGKLLNVSDFVVSHNAVVPFDEINEAVMHDRIRNGKYDSWCWRCESAFKLTGIQVNLEFIAGTCACRYVGDLDILDNTRAYHWPSEPFTRLAPAAASTSTLQIFHCPMKPTYNDPIEYQDIVLPVIQEDWKYNSRELKNNCTIVGIMTGFDVVQESGTKSQIYSCEVTAPKSKFWNKANFGAIGNVTITIVVKRVVRGKQDLVSCRRKGMVSAIQNGTGNIKLFIRVKIDSIDMPTTGTDVVIVPKPIKSQYTSTKHLIRKWAEKGDAWSPHSRVFLSQTIPESWTIPAEQLIRIKKSSYVTAHDKHRLKRVRLLLNSEQAAALNIAMNNSISFVHGPPGTGKTFTGAAITLTLSLIEAGPILVCASSNVAADGIALQIRKMADCTYQRSKKILRIFSKKRELFCENEPFDSFSSLPYDVLHQEVKRSNKWMVGPKVSGIAAKIAQFKGHCLTEEERNLLEEHVSSIELEIMAEYDIFVATIGTLADQRVKKWSSTREINTVIVDEIGQLTHPATLIAFEFAATRLVFLGDHLQLQAVIHSCSADIAGLGRSIMDWLSIDQNRSLPWTTLLEQHRMNQSIRKLVSTLTYQNHLKDAPGIADRKFPFTNQVHRLLPQLTKSSIGIFDHSNAEIRIGTNISNEGEASSIVELIRKFATTEIDLSEIIVLTLYEAQRLLIETKLRSLGGLDKVIQVSNVDGFQGRERSIVILSLVRSNTNADIGFAQVPNRLNVALSRAMYFLLIFCNFKTFSQHRSQLWKRFTAYAVQNAVFL